MGFDLSKRKPAGTSRKDCETAQRVNEMILDGEFLENHDLVSQVIAHTLLCDSCRKIFLDYIPQKHEESTAQTGE